jgi:membrane protein
MRKGLAAVAVGFAALTAVFFLSSGASDQKLDGAQRKHRGRDADTPGAIPMRGLRDVLWRVIKKVSNDRVTLVAAGVTFYLLLALFPGLSALVALYGFAADPLTMGPIIFANCRACFLPVRSTSSLSGLIVWQGAETRRLV